MARNNYKLKLPSKTDSVLLKDHQMDKLHTNIIHWMPEFKYKCEEWFQEEMEEKKAIEERKWNEMIQKE